MLLFSYKQKTISESEDNKLKKNEKIARRITDELVLIEDKETIMQKDDLILVENGNLTEISSKLILIGQKIEDYCGVKVKTNIHIDTDKLNVRFELRYGRYIEYEALGKHFILSINDKEFYVLRLKDISNHSRQCLVMKIMHNVFGL